MTKLRGWIKERRCRHRYRWLRCLVWLRAIYRSPILRTIATVLLGYAGYQLLVPTYFHEYQEEIDIGILILLAFGTTVAIIGLILSVVFWRARSIGLLLLLVGIQINAGLNALLYLGVAVPHVTRLTTLIRSILVVGVALLIVATARYIYEGIKLPPPWNSRRARREARKRRAIEQIRVLGLDEEH